MDSPAGIARGIPRSRFAWVRWVLMALVVEKAIQHVVVTLAFYFNWSDIESTVVVDPKILMVLGAVVAVLFLVSLFGLVRRRAWAVDLVIALAVFDVVGEFVAQGKVMILLTVSFLVAIVLLIFGLVGRRELRQAP